MSGRPGSALMRAGMKRMSRAWVSFLKPTARSGRLQATAGLVLAPAGTISAVWTDLEMPKDEADDAGSRQGQRAKIEYVEPAAPTYERPAEDWRLVRGPVDPENPVWDQTAEWAIESIQERTLYGDCRILEIICCNYPKGGNTL